MKIIIFHKIKNLNLRSAQSLINACVRSKTYYIHITDHLHKSVSKLSKRKKT